MKKKLEYLFWVWDPDLVGQQNEPTRILEEGFLDSESALVRKSITLCQSLQLCMSEFDDSSLTPGWH